MSIEFSPAFDAVRGTGLQPVSSLPERNHGLKTRATSSTRRVAANRRNAQRSTGPRTAAGKRRSSRNAIKHGLCSQRACLDGECPATYATFVHEIEEELQPRTAIQRSLVPHIANLMWRIDRMPEAQAKIFERELDKCADNEEISAAEVLARRFSDEPTRNGFLLMGRYERGLHNQLLRLLRQFEQSTKRRASTAARSDDEPPVPEEQAWSDAKMDAQRQAFARREAALERGEAPANEYEAGVDRAIRFRREHEKRTQTKPTENPAGASETGKCATIEAPPLTKRTQRDDDRAGDRRAPHPSRTASPPDALQSDPS